MLLHQQSRRLADPFSFLNWFWWNYKLVGIGRILSVALCRLSKSIKSSKLDLLSCDSALLNGLLVKFTGELLTRCSLDAQWAVLINRLANEQIGSQIEIIKLADAECISSTMDALIQNLNFKVQSSLPPAMNGGGSFSNRQKDQSRKWKLKSAFHMTFWAAFWPEGISFFSFYLHCERWFYR